jgi:hypothetical protein
VESISILGSGDSYEEAIGNAMVKLTECAGNSQVRVFRKEVPEDAEPFVDWALDIAEAELVLTNGGNILLVNAECTFWLVGSDVANED